MQDLERVESLDQFVRVDTANARKWQNTWDPRTDSAWLPWFQGEESVVWPTVLKST